jgi:DNA-binding transcriptional LysR family regulator
MAVVGAPGYLDNARRLALAGVGLARLTLFHIGPDIAAGRLEMVLEDLNPGDVEDIHAVFVGQGGHLPASVRAFIDYLAAMVRLGRVCKAQSQSRLMPMMSMAR